jgi:hypothetical protein
MWGIIPYSLTLSRKISYNTLRFLQTEIQLALLNMPYTNKYLKRGCGRLLLSSCLFIIATVGYFKMYKNYSCETPSLNDLNAYQILGNLWPVKTNLMPLHPLEAFLSGKAKTRTCCTLEKFESCNANWTYKTAHWFWVIGRVGLIDAFFPPRLHWVHCKPIVISA